MSFLLFFFLIYFNSVLYIHACELSHFSHVQLLAPLRTIDHQALLSMEFSRHEYWSGLPCPSPGDLPSLGTEPVSLSSPALVGGFFITSATWLVCIYVYGGC